jgi:hypothetical protein
MLLELNSGNLNLVAKNVIVLTTYFNMQFKIQSMNKTEASNSDNEMAFLRDYMIDRVTQLSVSDISSVKVISSALSAATRTPVQISTKSAQLSIEKSIEMVSDLKNMQNKTSFNDLKGAVYGIFDTIANSLIGVSSPINSRSSYLISDLSQDANDSGNTKKNV